MMRFINIIPLLLVSFLSLSAQSNTAEKKIELKDANITLIDSVFVAEVKLDFTATSFPSKTMMVLKPRLESLESEDSYAFDELIYVGRNRAKVLKRSDRLSGKETEHVTVVRKIETLNSEHLRLTVPYESWMNKSRIIVTEEVSGCANCDLGTNKHQINVPVLLAPYVPTYSLSYVTPEVEEIKQRSLEYTAKLNFRVAGYEIIPELSNNAAILAEVREVINKVNDDRDVTISRINMTGYASPEGNEKSNMTLSENRAKSFVNHLRLLYEFDSQLFSADWKGEDWEGLKRAVNGSSMSSKQKVLDILENATPVAERKRKLRLLEGGAVYKDLLANYYPDLRRNEMVIHFVVKAFDIEEAKEIIKTRPQYLSLNEMYLLANSYEKESKAFKEVFDIASRLYPDNQTAKLNTATAELEDGSVDRAIEKLTGIEIPEAWNNLAVAYAKKGDFAKAEELFRKAANAGSESASQNIKELQEVLNSQ